MAWLYGPETEKNPHTHTHMKWRAPSMMIEFTEAAGRGGPQRPPAAPTRKIAQRQKSERAGAGAQLGASKAELPPLCEAPRAVPRVDIERRIVGRSGTIPRGGGWGVGHQVCWEWWWARGAGPQRQEGLKYLEQEEQVHTNSEHASAHAYAAKANKQTHARKYK